MGRIVWDVAPDVQARLVRIVEVLGMAHVDPARLVAMRSTGSKARFLARIWPLDRVWQLALGVQPHYVIEVKHERFDRLGKEEQDRVLIHELLHIPRTFSGAVLPHRHAGGRIDHAAVDVLHRRWARAQADASAEPRRPMASEPPT
jgi:predicted metallopeptidase